MANSLFVCDTSVIVDGRILELVRKKEVSGKIIISLATLSELEHQANQKKETGFAGFNTINELRSLEKTFDIEVEFKGRRPSHSEIAHAKQGEIDSQIRELARELNATLITGDKVQHEMAVIEDIKTIYLRSHEVPKELGFKKYFTPETMSVHLTENNLPKAKLGKPGAVSLVTIGDKKLTTADVRELATEITEATQRNSSYYLEIEKQGATVIQMGMYRIVITKPPFSDLFEITIVRPIKKFSIEDYKMSEKLKERLKGKAEGIIVCGPPGSGKSTFSAALAQFYQQQGMIVKTMESPRDLQVTDEITQYAPLEGTFENTNEIMLLVRPDYSVYDEMRKTLDFLVYADMRLTGIGLVGVVHATKPIDAIQRFIGRVDLGMIPQIVDTIIFIKGGAVDKVLELRFLVRVPTGMVEQDLARPVIEVRDFESNGLEYEIYKFGEETVVLPLGGEKGAKERKERDIVNTSLVKGKLERALGRIVRNDYDFEVTGNTVKLFLDPRDIGSVLGRGGSNIKKIEKAIGMRIDIAQNDEQ